MQNSKDIIFKATQSFCPEWKDFSSEEAVVERMTGITNETYKVSHPLSPLALIYRKFGDASENLFLNREEEIVVYKNISDEGFGPKIYGYGQGIRIQEFIESKVLKTEQMLKKGYLQKIAYSLWEFHHMKVPENLPKNSLFSKLYFSHQSKIIEICQNKLSKPIFDEDQFEKVNALKEWVSPKQIAYLQELTCELEKKPFVFSHNDLLANNVLIREKDKKVIFIDYEYSCYNYPIFDIANFFNETEYDYDADETRPFFGIIKDWEGKQDMMDRFIRFYCAASSLSYDNLLTTMETDVQLSPDQQAQYEHLKSLLPLGQMLSNVMWGWWAIIVCKNPAIQFDYIEFAMKRLRDYNSHKAKLTQNN